MELPKNKDNQLTYWLFCKVIDNFGDIGVCWRLARQLCNEHNINVVLWVDDLLTFKKISPSISVDLDEQNIEGITVVHWSDEKKYLITNKLTNEKLIPDVLIETFACDLPEALQQWAGQNKVLWLNLEYLSAESWVEQMHLMPSPQALGNIKYFFFPGFSEKTGGLLREQNLVSRREAFLENLEAQYEFKQKLLLPEIAEKSFTIFIFAYESTVLKKWLELWRSLDLPMTIWLAPSLNLTHLAYLFDNDTSVGRHVNWGNLSIHILPMVSQQDFDQILWLSDINIVRGEDSVIRAHWADKPFFWHIYPQQEYTHLIKLNAFWDHVYTFFDEELKNAHKALSLELNHQDNLLSDEDRQKNWQYLFEFYKKWRFCNKKWTKKQHIMKSLSENLVKFTKKSLK